MTTKTFTFSSAAASFIVCCHAYTIRELDECALLNSSASDFQSSCGPSTMRRQVEDGLVIIDEGVIDDSQYLTTILGSTVAVELLSRFKSRNEMPKTVSVSVEVEVETVAMTLDSDTTEPVVEAPKPKPKTEPLAERVATLLVGGSKTVNEIREALNVPNRKTLTRCLRTGDLFESTESRGAQKLWSIAVVA